jgi:hypothetical protein
MAEGQVPVKEYDAKNTKHSWDYAKIRLAHRELAQYRYAKGMVEKGYANRTLYVNLTTCEISEKRVSEEMKAYFTGGRGFGLKLLWDAVKPETRWDSPENELVITTGPLCGTTQYPGSGKSLCLTVSPATNIICDSNVGGYFGPYLKFAGFDALEIQGKSKEDVLIVIDGERAQCPWRRRPRGDEHTPPRGAAHKHVLLRGHRPLTPEGVNGLLGERR